MAPERTVVRSANGFQFVPRYDFGTVAQLDRVLEPAGTDSNAKRQVVAAWSADKAHPPVEDIFQNAGNGETAYEATFEDLARTQGSSFARADASILFYVMDATRRPGGGLVHAPIICKRARGPHSSGPAQRGPRRTANAAQRRRSSAGCNTRVCHCVQDTDSYAVCRDLHLLGTLRWHLGNWRALQRALCAENGEP